MPKLCEKEILTLANSLPSVSNAAVKLVSLIDNPETSRDEIVDLLRVDEVLFAECFKQANSAAIGGFRKYVTINEIVDALGFSHIKRVSLYTAAKSVIDDPRIWFESVFIAMASDYLGRKANFSDKLCDAIYMSGLFLNYGSYLLKHCFRDTYRDFMKIADFQQRLKAEKQEFGFNHLQISAYLLQKFDVPSYVVNVIENQHLVYTDGARKENVIIEISRILQEMQDREIDQINKELNTDQITKLVADSGIEIVHIDEELISLFKEQASQFS